MADLTRVRPSASCDWCADRPCGVALVGRTSMRSAWPRVSGPGTRPTAAQAPRRPGAARAGAAARRGRGAAADPLEIFTARGRQPVIDPAWASVALALAAALVALDRYFGASDAWMRYMTAEMQIARLRQDFEYEWNIARAHGRREPAELDEVELLLALGAQAGSPEASSDAIAAETRHLGHGLPRGHLQTTEQALQAPAPKLAGTAANWQLVEEGGHGRREAACAGRGWPWGASHASGLQGGEQVAECARARVARTPNRLLAPAGAGRPRPRPAATAKRRRSDRAAGAGGGGGAAGPRRRARARRPARSARAAARGAPAAAPPRPRRGGRRRPRTSVSDAVTACSVSAAAPGRSELLGERARSAPAAPAAALGSAARSRGGRSRSAAVRLRGRAARARPVGRRLRARRRPRRRAARSSAATTLASAASKRGRAALAQERELLGDALQASCRPSRSPASRRWPSR